MSETWTKKSSLIDLNGFSNPIDSYRRLQNRRANRASGGIIVYIRDSIRKGVSLIKNDVDSIVWLKLDKYFFFTERDYYLAAIYIPPEHSPVHNLTDYDIFTVLENDVNQFNNLGKVFICGDTNSRIGNKLDFIVDDSVLECEDTEYTSPPPNRTSLDRKSNRFGENLIDLCKSCNLCIVNGRPHNDREVGNITCITHNGQSVVDYLITNRNNFNCVKNFAVKGFTQFSNHAPLEFSLKINSGRNGKNHFVKKVTRWDAQYREMFFQDLSIGIGGLEDSLSHHIESQCDSDTLIKVCTDFLKKRGVDILIKRFMFKTQILLTRTNIRNTGSMKNVRVNGKRTK